MYAFNLIPEAGQKPSFVFDKNLSELLIKTQINSILSFHFIKM